MRVKVSLSPEAWGKFFAGENFEIPGQWQIYYKRNLFDKWHPYGTGFADKNYAMIFAKKIKDLSIEV